MPSVVMLGRRGVGTWIVTLTTQQKIIETMYENTQFLLTILALLLGGETINLLSTVTDGRGLLLKSVVGPNEWLHLFLLLISLKRFFCLLNEISHTLW